PDAEHRALWLTSTDSLFAWIARQLPEGDANLVRWATGQDKVSQAQFHAHLEQTAEEFLAVEAYPHWPALPRHCYLHPGLRPAGGKALAQLVGRFGHATFADHDLIESFFLTLVWGGAPGQRPAFLVTTEDDGDPMKGRGAGKSTLIKVGA